MKKTNRSAVGRLLKDHGKYVKLDLGCGANKQPGFVGMDIMPLRGVDIVHDLETFPWPLPDNSVDFIVASHLLEHINPAKGGFLKFMDECWRIMKDDGQFMIAVPYAGSPGYWQDPTHVNPISHVTWAYFDPLAEGGLYTIYRPRPWKIVSCSYSLEGNMEAVLIKRRMDKSYGWK